MRLLLTSHILGSYDGVRQLMGVEARESGYAIIAGGRSGIDVIGYLSVLTGTC